MPEVHSYTKTEYKNKNISVTQSTITANTLSLLFLLLLHYLWRNVSDEFWTHNGNRLSEIRT